MFAIYPLRNQRESQYGRLKKLEKRERERDRDRDTHIHTNKQTPTNPRYSKRGISVNFFYLQIEIINSVFFF